MREGETLRAARKIHMWVDRVLARAVLAAALFHDEQSKAASLVLDAYPSLKPKLEALRFERESYERIWESDPLMASHLIPQVPTVYRGQ